MRIHGLLWFLAFLVSLLLSPLAVTPEHFRGLINEELGQTSARYGAREGLTISRRGEAIYDAMVARTGIEAGLTATAVPSAPSNDLIIATVERAGHVRQLERVVMGYVPGLLQSLYLFCLRFSHSWHWLIWLAPFLAALAFDGVMTRRAKLQSFQYTHPTVYNLSWHLIIAVFAASMLAYSLALTLPLTFYPFALVSEGVLLRLLLSNIQHSA
ncbi:MAG: DUF4400 domain-containing protein [Rhodocyclaceae bacterium]